jgi:hypothetical protein
MPKMTKCLLGNEEISISVALRLRDDARKNRYPRPDFRCDICGKPVRPHKKGGPPAAHFEHLDRNPNCPQSDPARD